MIVLQLIELLKALPPTMDVWLAGDAEGNDFRPLDDGPIEVLQADDRFEGNTGEKVVAGREVAVLWPSW